MPGRTEDIAKEKVSYWEPGNFVSSDIFRKEVPNEALKNNELNLPFNALGRLHLKSIRVKTNHEIRGKYFKSRSWRIWSEDCQEYFEEVSNNCEKRPGRHS